MSEIYNIFWGLCLVYLRQTISLTSWSMAQVAEHFSLNIEEIGSGFVRPIVYLPIGLLATIYVMFVLLAVERARTDGLGYFDCYKKMQIQHNRYSLKILEHAYLRSYVDVICC